MYYVYCKATHQRLIEIPHKFALRTYFCVKLLASAIGSDKSIKGLSLYSKEFKSSQYADDTTCLVADTQFFRVFLVYRSDFTKSCLMHGRGFWVTLPGARMKWKMRLFGTINLLQ